MLTAVYRSLNEGVVIMSATFNRNGFEIEYANDAMCRITGYDEEQLMGRGHACLHASRSDVQDARKWFKQLPAAAPHAAEGYLKHKNGETFYADWTLSPLTDSNGKLTQIVATFRDLSEKRTLQEALIHSQRLDAVGRLAGGVAHDFNNLLSVINGYSEILHETVSGNEKAQREITEIHQASIRATNLVRQLLAFGRRKGLDPRIIEPNRLIRENADILTHLIGPDHSLELNLDDEIGNIRIDPTQLQQALLNLTLNARDALAPNGHVTIATERRTVAPAQNRRVTDMSPGRYVVIRVEDNGCGMDEATQAVLFEPFFTTKEEGLGTGLGLALVYGVVQQNRGHIQVHSNVGEGTVFEIFLPAVREAASPTIGTLAPLPVTRGRETILVVDSDRVILKMVSGILAADGYEIIEASSPATALLEVKHRGKAVHLVITDRSNVSRETTQMLRTLHRHQAGLRVLNTPSRESSLLKWLPASRQHILTKPFSLSTLLRDTRRLLDQED